MKTAIVWLRDNLRLSDNHSLHHAISENDKILPVFVIDRRWLEKDRWGNARMGVFRADFLLESLKALQKSVEDAGGGLWVETGLPSEIILRLARDFGADCVYTSRAYTHFEKEDEQRVSEEIKLKLYDESTLIHPDNLPFSVREIPDIFTQFRQKVEKYCQVKPPISAPSRIDTPVFTPKIIPDLDLLGYKKIPKDNRAVMTFTGGEEAGKRRLTHYFYETRSLSHYKDTRNGLIGADYSSKFSPWLANGSLSPRYIYAEVKKYEEDIIKNESTYWLVFELLWRDFFKFMSMKYGARLFFAGGISGKNPNFGMNTKRYEQWKLGKTGQLFIDANMNELRNTGFMSNRGRQNVASYLVHNLGLDWRMGASWFESMLIDYDPCSNYGNWQYVAGVGNDPRENRVFNPLSQSARYDPEGEFQVLWK
ncbi:MAG: DASH family cryptochrome [Bacteroidia bacterium]